MSAHWVLQSRSKWLTVGGARGTGQTATKIDNVTNLSVCVEDPFRLDSKSGRALNILTEVILSAL